MLIQLQWLAGRLQFLVGAVELVEQALRLGYRHIDTAQIYDNEREVGEGLRASGIKRNDVFVTTKVWTTHFLAKDLERSAKESLARLRLTEVDLLLLHWPNPHVPLAETLGALARVRQAGLARHIGLSNFSTAQIEEAVAAKVEAAIAQLGYSPSPMAQALKRGRSRLIGLVVADVTNPFSVAVLRGAEQA